MAKKKPQTPNPGTKSPAACILPSLLYLAPASTTSNTPFLQHHGITHVLSIGKSPASHLPGITYLRLPLTDTPSSPIKATIDKACEFIDAAAVSNGRVLLHCSAAISRSPAVVAGYLIKRRGMTLRESLELLVGVRAVVAPNRGFLRQLGEMEREVFGGEGTFDVDGWAVGVKLGAYLRG